MSKAPNFLIVGVPKAGTSSLYNYLKQHPEIYLPEQKELHYFTHQELSKNTAGPGDKLALKSIINTEKDYLSLYKDVQEEKAIGDVSPSYFFFNQQAIPRIKNRLSKSVKIIILLRDPIDRAFSNFLHQKRLLFENLNFKESLDEEINRKNQDYGDFWRYKEHSLYYEKCKSFIDEFGPDNVKIILFEELVADSKKVIIQICDFLSVDKDFNFLELNEIHNKGGVYKKNKLTAFFLKPSNFKQLVQRLLSDKLKRKYKNLKRKILESNNIDKPAIQEETLKELKAFFESDVRNLYNLNIDTTKWNSYNKS